MDYHVQDYRVATIECVLDSSVRRNVPANVLLAIVQIEGAKEGLIRKNKNGSFDFGRWQINSVHLEEMARFGVSAEVAKYYLTRDGCYGADFAAYRLQRCLNDPSRKKKEFWERAACYHSKTLELNLVYQEKLKPLARRWADWLSTRYQVREIQP